MNLPLLIKTLYGTFSFTGLYSFEFQSNKKKITEIFFMMPPKSKSMDESTRSSTNPTLGGNYVTDAGNSTKTMNLKGELWFPMVGSPLNPVARDPSALKETIDGLTEFMSLRWYLMRYRDYTMTKNMKMDIPIIPMNSSPQVAALYAKAAKLVRTEQGALYDNIQLIVHDYDMDDHFLCRVEKFGSQQNDKSYISVEYDITLDCYQRYDQQSGMTVEIKQSPESQCDVDNGQLQNQGSSLSNKISNKNLFMVNPK